MHKRTSRRCQRTSLHRRPAAPGGAGGRPGGGGTSPRAPGAQRPGPRTRGLRWEEASAPQAAGTLSSFDCSCQACGRFQVEAPDCEDKEVSFRWEVAFHYRMVQPRTLSTGLRARPLVLCLLASEAEQEKIGGHPLRGRGSASRRWW